MNGAEHTDITLFLWTKNITTDIFTMNHTRKEPMMLHKVKNPNADKILPLLKGDSYALFAQAVLNGNAKGTVYVDDIQNPTVAAILSHEEERCYLTLKSAGNELKTWQKALSETVLRDQFEENGAAMEMFLHPEADESVHDIFRTMEAAWNPAYLFSWNNDRGLEPPSAIPDGFILQPVTQYFYWRLLTNKNYYYILII